MSILRPGGGLYWDTRTYILNIPIHEFFNWRTVQTWTIPIIFVYYMGHRRTKNRKQYHLEPNHGEKFISIQNERIGKKAYFEKKIIIKSSYFFKFQGLLILFILAIGITNADFSPKIYQTPKPPLKHLIRKNSQAITSQLKYFFSEIARQDQKLIGRVQELFYGISRQSGVFTNFGVRWKFSWF